MKFRAVRFNEVPGYATYATLFDEGAQQVAVLLELPFVDADNNGVRDSNVSRFQHGEYELIRRVSPKRGFPVWWYCGVPDVSSANFADEPTATTAQMHKANFPWQLEGCQGLGTAFGNVLYDGPTVKDGRYPREHGKSYPGVTGSGAAFDKFMALTADVDRITILVVDAFGAPAGSWA